MPAMPTEPNLVLTTVAGPTNFVVPLHSPGPVTFGRYPGNAVHLNHPLVSRNHAVLRLESTLQSLTPMSQWMLQDLRSVHGVRLNGTKLRADRAYAVEQGDLIAIEPWTFRLTHAQPTPREITFPTKEDNFTAPSICSIVESSACSLPQKQLSLLLEYADLVHQATDEISLVNVVLDAVIAGTGCPNGAWIRAMSPDDRADVLEYRGAIYDEDGVPRLSRSLIRRSLQGEPVLFSRQAEATASSLSITELSIEEAFCVPVSYSSTTMGFLYLDRRRSCHSDQNTPGDAGGFVLGLARLAGVAMSNLLRLDLEKRHLRITAELEAAAKVQQLILPTRHGVVGRFSYTGESVPGLHMGGDFFDVIPLSNNRLAITIGDVCGKGVAASFVMAVIQGFLHHALRESADPQAAVLALNDFLLTRLEPDKFVSLWVGVLDETNGMLTYVDAGHGYAVLLEPGREAHRLTTKATLLVGISPDCSYEPGNLALPETGMIALLSDGLVEQCRYIPETPTLQTASVPAHDELGVDAVIHCLQQSKMDEDQVSTLFSMVRAYAGRFGLDDDSTALLVRW